MIKVAEVTKKYPARVAVDNISFEVNQGEIVGFLGPNGAGKTTTMRMLTGYLSMNAGKIEIAGYDISAKPQEVRRRIGYLPESCPLYPEMRVDEYLRFRAELKGVKAPARKAKMDEVIETFHPTPCYQLSSGSIYKSICPSSGGDDVKFVHSQSLSSRLRSVAGHFIQIERTFHYIKTVGPSPNIGKMMSFVL